MAGAIGLEEILDFLDDDIVLLRNDGTVTWAGDADPIPGMTTICVGESGGPFERARAEDLVTEYALGIDGVGPLVLVEIA